MLMHRLACPQNQRSQSWAAWHPPALSELRYVNLLAAPTNSKGTLSKALLSDWVANMPMFKIRRSAKLTPGAWASPGLLTGPVLALANGPRQQG